MIELRSGFKIHLIMRRALRISIKKLKQEDFQMNWKNAPENITDYISCNLLTKTIG